MMASHALVRIAPKPLQQQRALGGAQANNSVTHAMVATTVSALAASQMGTKLRPPSHGSGLQPGPQPVGQAGRQAGEPAVRRWATAPPRAPQTTTALLRVLGGGSKAGGRYTTAVQRLVFSISKVTQQGGDSCAPSIRQRSPLSFRGACTRAASAQV